MKGSRWEEYFYDWSWPKDSAMAKDAARKVLGVGRHAGLSEIKRAYRRLALQLHPDTDMSDDTLADKFRIVAEAYEILTSERNARSRTLSAGCRDDADQEQQTAYPEWWMERFGELF